MTIYVLKRAEPLVNKRYSDEMLCACKYISDQILIRLNKYRLCVSVTYELKLHVLGGKKGRKKPHTHQAQI